MRVAFFLLLFANLAFLAWSAWIDVPQPATANEVYAKLPRLKLVGEDTPAPSASGGSPASAGKARKTSLSRDTSSVSRCFTVGPFDDEAGATRGTAFLREKGFAPRSRSAPSLIPKGFWVYIGDLKSDQDVSQVLLTLTQAHVDDAKVMADPAATGARRVSVGLFSDRERADRRAASVKKLGLEPQVSERKVSATLVWMDIDVPPGSSAPSVADLSAGSLGQGGANASAASSGAAAGASSAGGSASPGASKAASGSPSQLTVMPCPSGTSPASSTPNGSSPARPTPLSPAPTAPFRTKVATGSPPKTP